MRRALLATAATAGGLVALLALKPQQAPVTIATPQPSAGAPGAPAGAAQATGANTVTGQTVRTQYGPVQVQVTLANGRITGVKAVQVPPEHADAVPQLTQAAIDAQSAEIDAVSGATYTSEGYKESLQSALDRAAEGTDDGGTSGSPTAGPAGGDPAGGQEDEAGGYDY